MLNNVEKKCFWVNGNARIDGLMTVAGGAVISGGTTLFGGLNISGGSCADPGEAFGTCAINVDYAELYSASEAVEQGSLVSIDDSKEDLYVKQTRKSYDGSVIGIVSTSPAMVIEGSAVQVMSNYVHNPLRPAIAMAGRVPVKVSTENGIIKPGDLLVPSSTPGYAMRCKEKVDCLGSVVGKALQPFKGKKGKIMALVLHG